MRGIPYAIEDRYRCTAHFQPFEIERNGKECAAIQIDEVAAGKVASIRPASLQHLPAAIAWGKHFDGRSIKPKGSHMRREQNCFAPRKNLGPAVGCFSGHEFGKRSRHSPRGGNAH